MKTRVHADLSLRIPTRLTVEAHVQFEWEARYRLSRLRWQHQLCRLDTHPIRVQWIRANRANADRLFLDLNLVDGSRFKFRFDGRRDRRGYPWKMRLAVLGHYGQVKLTSL
ncbi:hypothetical protein ACI2UC_23800 [Ralstonia nicotianae]|uniref:hypothetical protein n=1 Tax=Ralstonia pseudosolanacearum TaxID=1310165 RepID=UPI003C213996